MTLDTCLLSGLISQGEGMVQGLNQVLTRNSTRVDSSVSMGTRREEMIPLLMFRMCLGSSFSG